MAIVYTDEQHYINIANSIRQKNGSTETYLPNQMAAAIDAISTGIDTSDATASGFDIAEGKTAYKNGGKITGVLTDYTEGMTYSCVTNADPTYIDGTVYSISSNSTMLSDVILRKDSTISMLAKAESFGDAKPEDVLEGRTFTSISGLKVEGTAISVGVDTYDADAYAGDIAKNKTAYVGGEKVTGTLSDVNTGVLQMNVSVPEEYAGVYYSVSDTIGEDRILRKGVEVKITMDKSSFGTATTTDVASGKTFTSENGLLINGEIDYGAYYDDTCTIKTPEVFEYDQEGFSQISSDFSGFDKYVTYLIASDNDIVGLAFKSGDKVYLTGFFSSHGSVSSDNLKFYGINKFNV